MINIFMDTKILNVMMTMYTIVRIGIVGSLIRYIIVRVRED